MKNTYTREEVINILVLAQMKYTRKAFEEGDSFGESAEKIIDAHDNSHSLVGALTLLK